MLVTMQLRPAYFRLYPFQGHQINGILVVLILTKFFYLPMRPSMEAALSSLR